MKKRYERPCMVCEEFKATEYVAACGDSGTVYNFECNAGVKGNKYYVYLNGKDGISGTSDDIDWSGRYGFWDIRPYGPCGEKHSAESDSGFEKGYMYRYRDGEKTGDPINVIVWTERGTDTHCTINLDMDSWETLKS